MKSFARLPSSRTRVQHAGLHASVPGQSLDRQCSSGLMALAAANQFRGARSAASNPRRGCFLVPRRRPPARPHQRQSLRSDFAL